MIWEAPPPGELVSEALARTVARKDPQAADVIAAQANRWRGDTVDTRAVEADLLLRSGPHQPDNRTHFSFQDLFEENLTVLHGGLGDHLFVYDHDLTTLYDGRPAGTPAPVNREAAWDGNESVAAALGRLLAGSERRRLRSIRLHLFEGTRRVAPVIAAHDAAALVSHLMLWTERDGPQTPVARLFPRLIGLSADPAWLPELLADGAPFLRSLVVYGRQWWARTLDLAAGLPHLVHLGLWAEDTEAEDVLRMARSPLLLRLRSLEFFGSNYTDRFPFGTVLAQDAFRSLSRLGLPGHLVGGDVRARFEDWPEVDFVGYDRRSRIAFDLETTGWAEYTR